MKWNPNMIKGSNRQDSSKLTIEFKEKEISEFGKFIWIENPKVDSLNYERN